MLVPAPAVAVLLPCHNEVVAIAQVVRDFARALPDAEIYVYDNNSTDGTAEVARAAGAVVRRAALQGKGNVVRRMFADVEADIYVLADGDGTYDAQAAPGLIARLAEDALDMVSGARVSAGAEAYRRGHRFGNRMLTGMVRQVFGRQFNDMLTGYRVFSRRFVKSFPAHSHGFEIETELTVHTLQMRLPSVEVETAYGARPEGSASKLNTVRDGLRILRMISLLIREEKPLQFFGFTGVVSMTGALLLGVPVVLQYLATGQVPRFPSLIVAVGLGVLALLGFACGLILDTVARARLEQRRLAYLALPAPAAPTLQTVRA
jgi:glycosyltransferase involved in cell wall biosynthesis